MDNSNIALKSAYPTDGRSIRDEELLADEAVLTRRASLIVALLLSLGLWAAIWAVVASLASLMLG
jgi:hypothetical protein